MSRALIQSKIIPEIYYIYDDPVYYFLYENRLCGICKHYRGKNIMDIYFLYCYTADGTLDETFIPFLQRDLVIKHLYDKIQNGYMSNEHFNG